MATKSFWNLKCVNWIKRKNKNNKIDSKCNSLMINLPREEKLRGSSHSANYWVASRLDRLLAVVGWCLTFSAHKERRQIDKNKEIKWRMKKGKKRTFCTTSISGLIFKRPPSLRATQLSIWILFYWITTNHSSKAHISHCRSLRVYVEDLLCSTRG